MEQWVELTHVTGAVQGCGSYYGSRLLGSYLIAEADEQVQCCHLLFSHHGEMVRTRVTGD